MSEIWLSNILLEEYFLTQDRFPWFGGALCHQAALAVELDEAAVFWCARDVHTAGEHVHTQQCT